MSLSYLYIGLLKNSELGLIEVLHENSNYRRIEICPGEWFFLDEDKKDFITNAVDIEFPDASNFWGLITHFGIFNSLQEGELLTVGTLNNPVVIESGSEIKFSKGSIEIPLEIFESLKSGVENG